MTTADNNAQIAELLTQVLQLMAPQRDAVPEPRAPRDDKRVMLTVEEAAHRLGIGRTVAYRLVRSGELVSVQIGRLRRIPAEAVSDYARRLVADGSRGN